MRNKVIKVKDFEEAKKASLDLFKDKYFKVLVYPHVLIGYAFREKGFMTRSGFSNKYGITNYHTIIEIDSGKTYLAGKLFEEHSEMLDGVWFDPDTTENVIEVDGKRLFNLNNYKGLVPEYDYDLEKISPILNYIKNVLANGDEKVAEIFHNFAYKTYFEPKDKDTILVINSYSEQRMNAKDFFGHLMENLLSYGNGINYNDSRGIFTSNFREFKEWYWFFGMNTFGGFNNDAAELTESKLKSFSVYINRKDFSVKRKYLPPYRMPNYFHWFFYSHSDKPLKLDVPEENYIAIKAKDIYMEDNDWWNLRRAIDDEEVLKHYLGYISQFKKNKGAK